MNDEGRGRRQETRETRNELASAVDRRSALGQMAAGVAIINGLIPRTTSHVPHVSPLASSGRLKHSVSRWCYGRIPLDDLCEAARAIGYKSVELLDEKDWGVPKKHG